MANNQERPTQMTAFFIVPAVWTATKRLAKAQGVSASSIIREALGTYLETHPLPRK